jgi:hypothetical protein
MMKRQKWVNGELVEVDAQPLGQPTDALQPIATRDGHPWELVGGIEFGRELVIYAADGEPVLRVRIDKTTAINPDANAAYRTLAKRFDDGSVKYLLIDFTRFAEAED